MANRKSPLVATCTSPAVGVAPVWWRDDDLAMELTRYAYLRLMLGAGGNHAPRGDDGPVPTAASSGTWRSNAAGER
jgi:hypothetical protein